MRNAGHPEAASARSCHLKHPLLPITHRPWCWIICCLSLPDANPTRLYVVTPNLTSPVFDRHGLPFFCLQTQAATRPIEVLPPDAFHRCSYVLVTDDPSVQYR
jgi:hypothetical protein